MQPVPILDAIAALRPQWLAMVVTRRPDGFVNVMPAGWVTRVSGSPPLFAVAISHQNYSNELLRQAGEFVLAFPAPGMEEAVAYCGSRSGRDGDKLASCGLRLTPAQSLATPLLADAAVNLECRLVAAPEVGDHTLFVGEVLSASQGDAVGPLFSFAGGLFALARPIVDEAAS